VLQAKLKVYTVGDAIANIAYRFTFSPKKDGVQKATVRRVTGEQAKGNGNDGDVLLQDVPVYVGEEEAITTTTSDRSGEHRFFAGIRSDPFFFDVAGIFLLLNFFY
jgi:Domain of unknown function (DUF4331)